MIISVILLVLQYKNKKLKETEIRREIVLVKI